MRMLNKYEVRAKEVRELIQERDQLYEAKYSLGYVKLAKPIRHGWFKHLELRDDIIRRMDAHVFQEILDKCGYDLWANDKVQLEKVWVRFHNRNNQVSYPGIRKISARVYRKLSVKAKKWFVGFDWYWSPNEGHVRRYYCRVPRYYFKIAYTKAYITKKQIIDPEIESRLKEIDEMLQNDEYIKYSGYLQYRKNWMPFHYHKRVRRNTIMVLRDYDDLEFDRRVFKDYHW